MTLGSCGGTTDDDGNDMDCIYVGDVGDNVALHTRGRRTDRMVNGYNPYRIIKFREPNYSTIMNAWNNNIDTVVIPDSDIFILPFDYLHESLPTDYSDCESMFVDRTGWGDEDNRIGDLYLITKWNPSTVHNNRLLRIPTSAWTGGGRTAEGLTIHDLYSPAAVGNFSETGDYFQYQWTGADMSRDGTVLSITTPLNTSLFLRCPGENVWEALTGTAQACHTFDHPAQGQVETSAFTPDGLRYLQIPEGNRPHMGWTDMLRNDPSSVVRVCPGTPTPAATSTSAAPPTVKFTSLAPTSLAPTSLATTKSSTNKPTLISPSSAPSAIPTETTTILASFASTLVSSSMNDSSSSTPESSIVQTESPSIETTFMGSLRGTITVTESDNVAGSFLSTIDPQLISKTTAVIDGP